MYKGKDIIGKPIVATDTGEEVAIVMDLIFDQDENRLLGFLLDKRGWVSNAKVLPLNLIESIVREAIAVSSASSVQCSSGLPNIDSILEQKTTLKSLQIITLDGRNLGKIVDVYFDGQAGKIEGYEVTGGIFTDTYCKRAFVPASHIVSIGEEVAFMSLEVADLIEEQIGKAQVAVQTAYEKLQRIAREKILAKASLANR